MCCHHHRKQSAYLATPRLSAFTGGSDWLERLLLSSAVLLLLLFCCAQPASVGLGCAVKVACALGCVNLLQSTSPRCGVLPCACRGRVPALACATSSSK